MPTESSPPGASSGSRAERKERTRRAILDAALALSADQPLAALSLRQVAKQVGVVPTAFYRHFASIEQLGLALVEESFGSLRGILRDVRRRSGTDYADIIDGSVAVLLEHVADQRAHLGFIARERFAGPAAVREEIARSLDLFERELATDLAHLPGTDTWSDADLRAVSGLIVNALVATIEALLAVPDGGDQQAVAAVAATARTQLRMLMVGALNWRSGQTPAGH